jgi:hypothetical protein
MHKQYCRRFVNSGKRNFYSGCAVLELLSTPLAGLFLTRLHATDTAEPVDSTTKRNKDCLRSEGYIARFLADGLSVVTSCHVTTRHGGSIFPPQRQQHVVVPPALPLFLA